MLTVTRPTADGSPSTSVVTDLATDGAGRFVALADESGVITVMDADAGEHHVRFHAGGGGNGSVVAVSRVAWADARFGELLATAADDGCVSVWKIVAPVNSTKNNASREPAAQRLFSALLPQPVTAIDWAPPEFGLMLASACSDGRVYFVSSPDTDGAWQRQSLDAHTAPLGNGCHAVSWFPFLAPSSLVNMPLASGTQQAALSIPPPRLVTSGLDRMVRVWRFAPQDRLWVLDSELTELSVMSQAYIRDVRAAPHHGLPFGYIAAGTEDGLVGVWRQDGLDGKWLFAQLPPLSAPVCRLSWSSCGTFLCVNDAHSNATLWMEDRLAEWRLCHNGIR